MVVSAVDGGKATDCELVNQSGLLRFLKPGNKVLADKVKLFPMELNHSGAIAMFFRYGALETLTGGI